MASTLWGNAPASIDRQFTRLFGNDSPTYDQVNKWVGTTPARRNTTIGNAFTNWQHTGDWFNQWTPQQNTSPVFDPNSLYGGQQDLNTSPFVTNSLSPQVPRGEYERFATAQGFGGMDRKQDFAQAQYNRMQSGWQAAQLTNPNLSWRDYLSGQGKGFLDNLWNSATFAERGVNPQLNAGPVRWIARG